MNREETIKLLALIKVAYPTAYRDMDNTTKNATVNMWMATFPKVPYNVMEMAFNHFRLVSKFPPTVADITEELKTLYYKALDGAMVARTFGEKEELKGNMWIMEQTVAYKNGDIFGLNGEKVAREIGDGYMDPALFCGENEVAGK